MSADDDLQQSLMVARRDRLRFEGLPSQTPAEIIRDAWERLLLTPEVQRLEPGVLAGFDSAASFLLALVPGNAAFAAYEAKGLGYLLHVILSVATEKAKRDQAGEGWTTSPPPG